MKNLYSIRLPFYLLTILMLWFIHQDLILLDPLLERDDKTFIGLIEHQDSFFPYFSSAAVGESPPYHPVSIFSIWINIKLQNIFGISLFHLTNFLIWLGILFLIELLLIRLDIVSSKILYPVLALYAIHPAFTSSIAWITVRKHLLSYFFILAATYMLCLIKENKQHDNISKIFIALSMVVFYLLSVFSMPLSLLWLLWALFYVRKEIIGNSKIVIISLAGCLIVSMYSSFLNYLYLIDHYIEGGNISVVSKGGFSNIGVSILALGRYFFQLVFPFYNAVVYYVGSSANLIGIVLWVAAITVTIKFLKKETALTWLIFYHFPLFMLTFKMSRIFVANRYLLIPSFGLLVLFLYLLNNWSRFIFHGKIKYFMGLLFLIVYTSFFIESFNWAKAFKSDYDLWRYSYYSEKTPRTLSIYGSHLLKKGDVKEAFTVANQLIKWDPGRYGGEYLFTKSVYLHEELTEKNKIKLLKDNYFNGPWFNYHLAALYARRGNWVIAHDYMLKGLVFIRKFDYQMETVLAEAYYICIKSQNTNCGETIHKVKNEIDVEKWNEKAFKTRLESLGMNLSLD